MLEFLMLLTLFLRPLYSGLLLALGKFPDEIPLATIYIVVAAADYLYIFTHYLFRYRVREKFWVAGIIMALLLALQLITGLKYDGMEGDYLNSVLSFAALSIPAFLMGLLFVEKHDYTVLGKILPFFIVIISAVVLYADLSTIDTWNGLFYSILFHIINYQSCTYYAAYAFGLTAYYLLYLKEMKIGQTVQKIIRPLFIILMPMQIFVVLTAGGRGGFLLGGFLMVYFLSAFIIKYQKKPAYYITGIGVLVLVATGLMFYFAKNGETIQGFSRLASFLNKPEDSARENLYGSAIECFLQQPILGNGVGSVWFTVGFYSHDIFCDLLCETGIVGTGLSACLLCYYLWKTYIIVRKEPIFQFGLLMFFFVFVMLIFSGYYLTEPMLWFALAYSFFAKITYKEEKNASTID